MSDPKYLITGATGATGGAAIEALLEAGQSVRAFVHREDERSKALQSKGVDVVVGNLNDLRSVKEALVGVRGAYFCYPIAKGIVQSTAQFAMAAKEAGVELMVNMSQIIAREDAPSNASAQHWLAERVFDWSGVPVTHLRPTFFTEWLLAFSPMIRQGAIYAPFGSGKSALVAGEDQGRIISAVLQNPEAHRGQTYVLYGSIEYTFAEVAEVVGKVLNREIGYQQVPFETMFEAFTATVTNAKSNSALTGYAESNRPDREEPTFIEQHLSEAVKDHNHGHFAGTNDVIESITGRAPMTIEDFVLKHQAVFV